MEKTLESAFYLIKQMASKLFGIEDNANNYVHPATHSADILTDGTTKKAFLATERTKLTGIETGAEVNNISDANALALTSLGETNLHIHDNRYATEIELSNALVDMVNATDSAVATPVDIPAVSISVADAGGYYAGVNVETVLQEIAQITGTFVPTLKGAVTPGVGTYTTQYGHFVKQGKVVTFTLSMTWTNHTGTGNMMIAGLPYTSKLNSVAPVAVVHWDISMTAGKVLCANIGSNDTEVGLMQTPTGGGAINTIPMDTAGFIMVAGTYICA